MKKLLSFSFLLLLVALISLGFSRHLSGWVAPDFNPDAGLVPSFTLGAKAEASSNSSEVSRILDGDPGTAWQSDAPLPEAFIRRTDQNIFFQKGINLAQCKACENIEKMTDGDLSSFARIGAAPNEERKVSILLGKADSLFSVSLKCQARAPITIEFENPDGQIAVLGSYETANNFQLKRWEVPGSRARTVHLSSDSDFDVFEIAALAGLPKEFVIVDFGSLRPLGAVYSRHWAGEQSAVSASLWQSTDRKHWTKIGELNSDNLQTFISAVSPETPARYLKIEHTLEARDWNKVFVWELQAYDRYGHYGPPPSALRGSASLREMLGVNAYWSWGTNLYSDQLKPDGGPWRYLPVASHLRNYHDMTWDIERPGAKMDFKEMARGRGTPSKDWLNWDREYGAWKEAGFDIQTSLQFYRFDPDQWKNPRQEGYDYAFGFTRHFGSKEGNGLVCTIEAGNEPWSYPADVYREILLGMAEGAAQGDSTVEVFPCALQAANPSAETVGIFKNYMGARISQEAAQLLDGINIHAYSYLTDSKGRQKAVHPEHAHSTFWEILNAIRWRNQNMPGKKIYLSEWGWESPGAGEECTHNECVSEEAAARYAIRAALIASRLGLDRITWFYYANDNSPSSLYTRSGLTGSANVNFQKKKAFFALQSLVERAGGQYFHSIVREDEVAVIYLLGDAAGKPTHLIGWLPVDGDSEAQRRLRWKTKLRAAAAFRLDGESEGGTPAALPWQKEGEMWLELTAAPLIVKLAS